MTRSSAQHPQAPQMTAAAWGLLVVLGFVWGGSFFFAGYAVREVGPLTLTALRVGIAAVALWVWVIASGHRVPLDNRLWGAFAMMGLLNNAVPFSLIFWGQTEIASGLASILNATTPLFTVVLAHGLTADEKMTAGKAGGVLFGLLGVAVIMGPDAVAGLGGARSWRRPRFSVPRSPMLSPASSGAVSRNARRRSLLAGKSQCRA